jgi:uncharacterized integral membrane protein
MARGGQVQPRGRETTWRTWALVVALVLVIIFIAVNAQKVTVDFVFFDTSMALAFALLIATVLGFIIGYVVARVRSGRRGAG